MPDSPDYPSQLRSVLHGAAERMDVDGYLSVFTDDVRFRVGSWPPARGKDSVGDLLKIIMLGISGIHYQVLNEWKVDDEIIHELNVRYTRRNGSQVSTRQAAILRLRNGLICEYDAYTDLQPLFT